MDNEMIILASGSPRRKALLDALGWKFRVAVPNIDETIFHGEDIREAVQRVSAEKARSIHSMYPGKLVIAADTVVLIGDRILGKPADRREAQDMILSLNGRTHRVITGVALFYGEQITLSSEITEVTFRNLDHSAVEAYVATGEGFDKAGAYAIQGRGSLLVSSIRGCYYNVVGLPVHLVSSMMEKIGFSLSYQWGALN